MARLLHHHSRRQHDKRMDTRSFKQFRADIREGHESEWRIIKTFARIIERETGVRPMIRANGSDMSGRYLRPEEATCDADFWVGTRLVEVKFDRTFNKHFHLKVHQLEAYVRQGAVILFVRGYGSGRELMAILEPKKLLEAYPQVWHEKWQEMAVRVPAKDIHWTRFR